MVASRRNLRLTVGSVSTGAGFVVEDLKVDFEITKLMGGAPNTGIVRIYNLSERRRTQLETQYNKVILEFGYNDVLSVLFVGEIYNVITSKQKGVDLVTTLYLGSGLNGYQNATVHKTFEAGTGLRDLVTAVGAELESFGVDLGFVDPSLSNDTTNKRGTVYSGAARTILDNLLRDSGLKWSIEDDKLEVRKVLAEQNTRLEITPANGLIGSAKRTQAGFDFDCVLNPGLRSGHSVGVFSDFIETSDPSLNFRKVNKRTGGYVQIINLKHTGSNRDGQAISSVVGIR